MDPLSWIPDPNCWINEQDAMYHGFETTANFASLVKNKAYFNLDEIRKKARSGNEQTKNKPTVGNKWL
jgi:hypothetical protein